MAVIGNCVSGMKHIRNGFRITTWCIYPPIPIRTFDWAACFGDPDLGVEVAYGKTEEDAIRDLLENYDTPEAEQARITAIGEIQ